MVDIIRRTGYFGVLEDPCFVVLFHDFFWRRIFSSKNFFDEECFWIRLFLVGVFLVQAVFGWCPFWLVLFLVFFDKEFFQQRIFSTKNVFDSCYFWLVLFLVGAIFDWRCFWLVLFFVGALFGWCSFWFVPFLVLAVLKTHVPHVENFKLLV